MRLKNRLDHLATTSVEKERRSRGSVVSVTSYWVIGLEQGASTNFLDVEEGVDLDPA